MVCWFHTWWTPQYQPSRWFSTTRKKRTATTMRRCMSSGNTQSGSLTSPKNANQFRIRRIMLKRLTKIQLTCKPWRTSSRLNTFTFTMGWRISIMASYFQAFKIKWSSCLQPRASSWPLWQHSFQIGAVRSLSRECEAPEQSPPPHGIHSTVCYRQVKSKLYGQVARHVDVKMCPVGSIVFYLFYHFLLQKKWRIQRLTSWIIALGLISSS